MYFLEIGCKGSVNRMNFQIILRNSEMQPTFNSQKKLKLVQTERKNKFICNFSEVQPNFILQSRIKVVQTERIISLALLF